MEATNRPAATVQKTTSSKGVFKLYKSMKLTFRLNWQWIFSDIDLPPKNAENSILLSFPSISSLSSEYEFAEANLLEKVEYRRIFFRIYEIHKYTTGCLINYFLSEMDDFWMILV